MYKILSLLKTYGFQSYIISFQFYEFVFLKATYNILNLFKNIQLIFYFLYQISALYIYSVLILLFNLSSTSLDTELQSNYFHLNYFFIPIQFYYLRKSINQHLELLSQFIIIYFYYIQILSLHNHFIFQKSIYKHSMKSRDQQYYKKQHHESPKRRERYRSRSKSHEKRKLKQLILEDAKQKQLKMKQLFGWTNQDNPFGDKNLSSTFVWNKTQQDTLNKMLSEGRDQKSIRQYFAKRQDEVFKTWENLKSKRKEKLQVQQKNQSQKSQLNLQKQELTYEQYLQKQEQFHSQQQLIRAFYRIQQGRQLPIDKFIKIIYIYKGKLKFQKNLVPIMTKPKHYLSSLSKQQLMAMLPQAQIHGKIDRRNNNQYVAFWDNLIQLIKYKAQKKSSPKSNLKKQLKQKIKNMLNKQLPQLQKLQQNIKKTLKTATFDIDTSYYETILKKLFVKKLQCKLVNFYNQFMLTYVEQQEQKPDSDQQQRIVTSPILMPFGSVAQKLLTTDEAEKIQRDKLAQKIFKQDYQKAKNKLQTNLSLPKNHNLLSTSIIEDVNTTYDYIAQEILQFERFKRLQQDQQDFNDWLPIETQGRFRDRKPIYVNRVRLSCQWNKYNQTHFDNDNPPPKTVQGYKFNIFYPDLLDKSKTPQYYLEPTQNPDFCLIKFKAGPPYLDIAFKIYNRQWDFSDKSGFQSIFAKGILHLYFNFKKPRFRI